MRDDSKPEVKRELRELDGILPESIDRRKFLTGTAATIFGGLAGCSGDNGGSGGTGSGDGSPGGSGGDGSTPAGDGAIVKNTLFRNAWKNQPHYAVSHMAVHQGHWADAGIAPPNVRAGFGSDDTANRVGNHREEFGFGSFSAVVPALGAGRDIKLFGTGRAITQLSLFYREDRMEGIDDLANKTIITQDPFGRSIWPLFAEVVGAPDSVTTQYAQEAAATALLNEGEGDAVFGFFGDLGSFQANVNAELGVYPMWRNLKVTGYPLYTNSQFMDQEDAFEYTVGVLEGYSQAGKWTLLNPEEALDIMRNEVNPELQAQERSTQMDTMKAGVGAVNLSEGVQDNGFAYLDREVLSTSLDSVGEALDQDGLPSAEEVGLWDVQNEAELATFSSDEWDQVYEWAQPYSGILLD